jgi:hypothetical protein
MRRRVVDTAGSTNEAMFEDAIPLGLGRRSLLKGALASAPMLLVGPSLFNPRAARAAGSTGPSTTTEPYLVPSVPGVKTVSILTTGDSVNSYRLVGIPDGLGAFRGRRGDFTLLVNHEITAQVPGIVRAHGSAGAFVSRWRIDRKTLTVLEGQDHTPSADDVFLWDAATGRYTSGTTLWQRLCSADLPAESALWAQGRGTRERIFMDGEEVNQGRAWARVATGSHTGEAWQLPRLGRLSYENIVASPHPQRKTVAILLDDSSINTFSDTTPLPTDFPSEVYVYIGTKGRGGHPVEDAGLTNGKLYGVKVVHQDAAQTPVAGESNDFGLGSTAFVGTGRFSLVELGPDGDVSSFTAEQLEQESINKGVCRFQRVEDGAWDPRNQDDFYFVTTASLTANCRLWRLRFDDVERPENGGTITILLKGDEGHRMLDNVTIVRGRILMDEDPGNSDRISKIWMYLIGSGELIQVAAHNPKFFDPSIPNNPDFLTQDEESSGIIDAEEILGKGWFLLDVQVHKPSSDPELVEGGQLLALFVDPRIGTGRDDDDDHGHDDDDDDDQGHGHGR